MLYYDSSHWTVCQIFQLRGSVFPKALVWAVPSALIAVAFPFVVDALEWSPPQLNGSQIWACYNASLGFLLVFRTQQAYSRWWEGGALLQQVRGEWYNAVSSLIAFTAQGEETKERVVHFQQLLVRLMSMLYCSALQQVAMMQDERFEILDTRGFDEDSLRYLRRSRDRCEVLMQWIQRLITTNASTGVLPVAPPVLSRVFQELSRGSVNLNNARKIKEFPFPFPYSQMITFMLTVHWCITPVANCMLVENQAWAAILTFISVFAFWSFNYIAIEIEAPFGDEVNHLPIRDMQREMNRSLWVLLDEKAQTPPTFEFDQQLHHRCNSVKGMKMWKGMTRVLSNCWPLQDLQDTESESDCSDGMSLARLTGVSQKRRSATSFNSSRRSSRVSSKDSQKSAKHSSRRVHDACSTQVQGQRGPDAAACPAAPAVPTATPGTADQPCLQVAQATASVGEGGTPPGGGAATGPGEAAPPSGPPPLLAGAPAAGGGAGGLLAVVVAGGDPDGGGVCMLESNVSVSSLHTGRSYRLHPQAPAGDEAEVLESSLHQLQACLTSQAPSIEK